MDLRPSVDLASSVFGLAITVTRPAPDDTPIATTGIWLPELEESRPYGTDFQRTDPRRVMAIPREEVPTMARWTAIAAPELDGQASKDWLVDEIAAADAQFWRVVLVQR